MQLQCRVDTRQTAETAADEEDEEQHSETAPPNEVKQKHVSIREWAAYYLQIRDPSPDEHRLQRLQRLFEVSVDMSHAPIVLIHILGCRLLYMHRRAMLCYMYHLSTIVNVDKQTYNHDLALQELIIDWYVRMEAGNLDWLRRNQKTIRAELYGGLVDAIQAGDTDASQLGKRTVLPASFTGSPRNVSQNYQVSCILKKL